MSTIQPSDGDTPQTLTSPDLKWSEPASEPAVSTPPVETPSGTDAPGTDQPPASATTSPVPTAANGAGATPQGFIPDDRHKAILEAERTRYSELDAKWQRVSWAESLAQAGFSQEDAILLARNPVGFIDTISQRIESNPQLAPQLRSLAARILGSHQQAQVEPVNVDPEPQPDAIGEYPNGQRVNVYSPDQQRKWNEWNHRQIDAKIAKSREPYEQEKAAREQTERIDAIKGQALEKMHERVEQLRQQPLFVEHEKAFQVYVAGLVRNGQYPTIDQAWNDFYFSQVHPVLGRTEQARAVAELQTRAAASSAQPRAATTSTPANVTRMDDPRLQWW